MEFRASHEGDRRDQQLAQIFFLLFVQVADFLSLSIFIRLYQIMKKSFFVNLSPFAFLFSVIAMIENHWLRLFI
jgi:hypothetical protein